jgi:multidrug efflux system membrane fusion protein
MARPLRALLRSAAAGRTLIPLLTRNFLTVRRNQISPPNRGIPVTEHNEPSGAEIANPWSTRRRQLYIIAGILAALLVVWFVARRGSAPQPRTGGFGFNTPLPVGTATVSMGDVPITINALGTITPLATVAVRPQVNGPLIKIAFNEGQMVKAGDVLAEIDSRPFQATLDQAKGQLARDEAQLANARVDLSRYKMLLEQNSVSQQQYDTQVALVNQDEAVITADKASVESATINLGYCRIVSPVTGRVGLRQVDLGNLLQANSSTIAVVTRLQPISVLFTVPEDNLGGILSQLKHDAKLPVEAWDRSLTNKLSDGMLATADNQIDTTTGTLKLRGMFDNVDGTLFPNQFVNVKLLVTTLHDQVVVSGAAVQNGASGNYVYLVNGGDSTVNMRTVSLGATSGDKVVVKDGLKPGDVVVTDGADQLRDGARVILPGAAGNAPPAADGKSNSHRQRANGGNGPNGNGPNGGGQGGDGQWHRRQGQQGQQGGGPPGP